MSPSIRLLAMLFAIGGACTSGPASSLAQATKPGSKAPAINPSILDNLKPGQKIPDLAPKLEIGKCPYVDLGIERLELTKVAEVPNGFVITLTAHIKSTGSHPPYARDSYLVEFFAGTVSKGEHLIDPDMMIGGSLSIASPRFPVTSGPDGKLTASVSARIKRGPRARPTDQDCNPTNDAALLKKDEVTRILLTR